MQIVFDQQDLTNAVCFGVAARYAGGRFIESKPWEVEDVTFTTIGRERHADALHFGFPKVLGPQDIVDAICLMLNTEHNFRLDLMEVELTRDAPSNQYGAIITITSG